MEENQNVEQVQEEKVEETTQAVEENETSETEAKLVEAEAKAAEYLDRWQRLMAEFDNYRKRSEKEKADSQDYAISNTIVELLPVIDNFERALKVESTDKALFAGVEMIYKQMMGLLEKLHVTPIEAVGKEFDPNLHNAIMHIDDEAFGENTVAEELQKGYLYKEKVIRYSLVKVAN
ncbi:MAG: nucleotide exchange factor GrpE [Cellulosilyticum sp.]|nr:nucleotide exchange factor GrpE [Cellulosilyticum sp.]